METRKAFISESSKNKLINAMTSLEQVTYCNELSSNVDDQIMERNNRRSTFLPKIIELQKIVSEVLEEYNKVFDISDIKQDIEYFPPQTILRVELDPEVEKLIKKAISMIERYIDEVFS